MGTGDLAKILHRLAHQLGRLHRLDVEALLSGLHPRQGEQILGEARHADGVLADDFQKIAVVFRGGVEQGLGVSLNRSQGSAQFVRYVGDEVAARLLDAFGLGLIAQHGDCAPARHGRRGHVKSPAGQDRTGSAGAHSSFFARGPQGAEKIGIADRFLDRCIPPGSLGNQPVHGLIGPLHALVLADGDDRVLHAVQQSLQPVLAGAQSGKAFLELVGGFVERGGDLSDFVVVVFRNARPQIAGSNLARKLHDALQPPGRRLRQNPGQHQRDGERPGGSPEQSAPHVPAGPGRQGRAGERIGGSRHPAGICRPIPGAADGEIEGHCGHRDHQGKGGQQLKENPISHLGASKRYPAPRTVLR